MKLAISFFVALALGAAQKPSHDTAPKDKQAPHGEQKDGPMSGHFTTVTGCLIQGEEEAIYFIHAANGRNYSITTSEINLQPHVGQTLTVTGIAESADYADGSDPALLTGKLEVIELKIVSPNCGK